jgi:hypothetical protein
MNHLCSPLSADRRIDGNEISRALILILRLKLMVILNICYGKGREKFICREVKMMMAMYV